MRYLFLITVMAIGTLFTPLQASAQEVAQCTTSELDLVCAEGEFLRGISSTGQKICETTIGGGAGTSCINKRSETYDKDSVTWCTGDFPNLSSCRFVDDQAPNTALDLTADCPDDGECAMTHGTRARNNLGEASLHAERVVKKSGGVTIEGCSSYDDGHSHNDYKTDVMCCR